MTEDNEKQEPDEEEPEDEFDEEEARNQMAMMMASVRELAISNLSVLATQAWHHLGLVPIPGTEEKMDLQQAKLAIDLFDANLRILSEGMDDDLRRDLKRTLADLQMNYVNKSG
jgi:uncharacterized protein (UPF0254 family)